jgi:polysaccharide biosynthesis/export protein
MEIHQSLLAKRYCFLFLSVLYFASNIYAGGAASEALAQPSNEHQLTQLADYRFSPGDVIEVKYYYNSEMNEVLQIRPDGKIALPLIGDVDIDGKTVAAASRHIEELYVPHLKTPKVTIHIKTYAAQKVYVGGEVLRPGVVSLSSRLTLLGAIMEAGGGKPTASLSIAVLIRTSGDSSEIKKIPLKGQDGQLTKEAMTLLLRPYDVVLLPEKKIVKVDRWVDQYIKQLLPFAFDLSYIFNPATVR